MNGNKQIIDGLNIRLIEEFTTINQYKVNKSLFDILGYSKLSLFLQERINDEVKHYSLLLYRLRFLDSEPIVGKLNEVNVSQDIQRVHQFDRNSELNSIVSYSELIKLCISLGDTGTRKVLEMILSDEEHHMADVESHLIQIGQIGLQNYLSANL